MKKYLILMFVLILSFGGVVVDICSEDWAPGVQAATKQVQPYVEWELTFAPIEETLIVFVDSVEMSDLDWDYNSLTNSVEFLVITPVESFIKKHQNNYTFRYGNRVQ